MSTLRDSVLCLWLPATSNDFCATLPGIRTSFTAAASPSSLRVLARTSRRSTIDVMMRSFAADCVATTIFSAQITILTAPISGRRRATMRHHPTPRPLHRRSKLRAYLPLRSLPAGSLRAASAMAPHRRRVPGPFRIDDHTAGLNPGPCPIPTCSVWSTRGVESPVQTPPGLLGHSSCAACACCFRPAPGFHPSRRYFAFATARRSHGERAVLCLKRTHRPGRLPIAAAATCTSSPPT